MHGTVDGRQRKWDSFVITEDDYVDFLSRMASNTAVPSLFKQHFHNRQFLFLGYGLRDWNLRVILRDVFKDRQDKLRSWAIQSKPTELERKLWEHRNVNIYDVEIDEFVNQLRARRNPPPIPAPTPVQTP